MAAVFGTYGKHPGFGDFIAGGFSDGLQAVLERWTATVLPPLKSAWGDAWEARFDGCPVVGVWIGAAVSGAGAFLGAMLPSKDKVGRRFPLILGWEGSFAAPFHDPGLTAGVVPGIQRALAVGGGDGDARAFRARLAAASGPPPPEVPPPSFWAARQDGNLVELLTDVGMEEAWQSGSGRSCLWLTGPRAVLYATDGLPDAAAVAWMLDGAPVAAEEVA
jgi:type VI secretion system protein ImpM